MKHLAVPSSHGETLNWESTYSVTSSDDGREPDRPHISSDLGFRSSEASNGALAQLGEHLLCKQGVIGSIPIRSTTPFGVDGMGR